MAGFDNMLRLSLGSSSFQLADYELTRKAAYSREGARIGIDWRISGIGWIEGANPDDFGAKIAAVQDAFRDGQDVRVWGLGATLETQLLAAWCLSGGPHIDELSLLPQIDGAGLVKDIRFSITARTGSLDSSGGSDPKLDVESEKMSVATRADDLQTVTFTGKLLRPEAMRYFSEQYLPSLLEQFPRSMWIPQWESTQNFVDDEVEYRVVFTQLLKPLPTGPANASARDGELIVRSERDEQMRLLTTYAYDLLLVGDPAEMLKLLRPNPIAPLVRESFEYSTYKEVRLRATFVLLTGADGNDLLDWQQSIDVPEPAASLRVPFEYPGRPPLFGRNPNPLKRVVQQGRAVGLRQWVKAPEAATQYLSEPPRTVYRYTSTYQHETIWTYNYVFGGSEIDAKTLIAQLGRPAKPEFIGPVAGGEAS